MAATQAGLARRGRAPEDAAPGALRVLRPSSSCGRLSGPPILRSQGVYLFPPPNSGHTLAGLLAELCLSGAFANAWPWGGGWWRCHRCQHRPDNPVVIFGGDGSCRAGRQHPRATGTSGTPDLAEVGVQEPVAAAHRCLLLCE